MSSILKALQRLERDRAGARDHEPALSDDLSEELTSEPLAQRRVQPGLWVWIGLGLLVTAGGAWLAAPWLAGSPAVVAAAPPSAPSTEGRGPAPARVASPAPVPESPFDESLPGDLAARQAPVQPDAVHSAPPSEPPPVQVKAPPSDPPPVQVKAPPAEPPPVQVKAPPAEPPPVQVKAPPSDPPPVQVKAPPADPPPVQVKAPPADPPPVQVKAPPADPPPVQVKAPPADPPPVQVKAPPADPASPPPATPASAGLAPEISVLRTSWHPTPGRRAARVRIAGSEAARDFHEGDVAGALRVEKIEPSAVVFTFQGRELRRTVGQ